MGLFANFFNGQVELDKMVTLHHFPYVLQNYQYILSPTLIPDLQSVVFNLLSVCKLLTVSHGKLTLLHF